MRSTTLWRALLLVALVGTAWLLLAPAPPQPPGPEGVGDKAAHVALFATNGVLAALAFRDRPRWQVWAALVLFGAAVEVLQAFVLRTPSLGDLLADALGAAAAWLVRPTSQEHS